MTVLSAVLKAAVLIGAAAVGAGALASDVPPDAVSDGRPGASAGVSQIAATPFPVSLGGPFDLIDHHGERRTDRDFHGRHTLIFFGYALCPGICSAALPTMAAAVDALGDKADLVQPLMITVDPDWDTPEVMKEALGKYHPRLLGLTGSQEALADVRKLFQVEVSYVGEDILGNPIYSHGGFVYLMGPDGALQTVIPPILNADQMADIIEKYLTVEG